MQIAHEVAVVASCDLQSKRRNGCCGVSVSSSATFPCRYVEIELESWRRLIVLYSLFYWFVEFHCKVQ